MNWKIKKGVGNVLKIWTLYQDEISICEIRMFTKGYYTLPTNLFPGKGKRFTQQTKDLNMAKNKCEKWVIDFSKSILNK